MAENSWAMAGRLRLLRSGYFLISFYWLDAEDSEAPGETWATGWKAVGSLNHLLEDSHPPTWIRGLGLWSGLEISITCLSHYIFLVLIVTAARGILTNKSDFLTISVSTHRLFKLFCLCSVFSWRSSLLCDLSFFSSPQFRVDTINSATSTQSAHFT